MAKTSSSSIMSLTQRFITQFSDHDPAFSGADNCTYFQIGPKLPYLSERQHRCWQNWCFRRHISAAV